MQNSPGTRFVLGCFLLLIAFPAHSKLFYQQITSFGLTNLAASRPVGALIQASDGFLYGTSSEGGYDGGGTVFRIQADGSGFHVIHSFKDLPFQPKYPVGGVIEASDGQLYGTVSSGGTSGFGAVFSLDKGGKNPATLHSFGSGKDGRLPYWGVIEGTDGFLFGTTTNGGLHDAGTIFKLNKNGTDYSILYNFMTNNSDGRHPCGGVMEGSDGMLYGSTRHGGTNTGFGYGTIYRINTDGTGYTVLHRFIPYPDGAYPMAPPLEADDGFLYGTAEGGGAGYGCIFKMQTDGSHYEVIKNFGWGAPDPTGYRPVYSLVQGAGHFLYGTTLVGGEFGYGTLFRLNTNGQEFSIIHQFGSSPDDAIAPRGMLLRATNGYFYGTTTDGGGFAQKGTLFRFEESSLSYEVLYRVNLLGGDHGVTGGLIEGGDGRLYGTSGAGGAFANGCIFSCDKSGGDRRILHSFKVGPPFPRNAPEDSLLFGKDGFLYGTTTWGGPNDKGVLYKISPDGTGFTVLHEFVFATGDTPATSLIEGNDGMIYGGTVRGGNGGGVRYKVKKDGTEYTVLQSFASGEINFATAKLVGTGDVLYGSAGGGTMGAGVIFRVNRDGTGLVKLRDFNTSSTPGYFPSVLLEGSDGALYGTCERHRDAFGHVFRLTKDNSTFTILRQFNGSGDGATPWNGLIESADGTLYGATSTGGTNKGGTIYALNKDGTGYHIVHHFKTNNYDGIEPRGELLYASDGNIYGTSKGGQMKAGTIFRLGLNLSLQVTQNIARVKMDAAPGKNYVIERSTNLGSLWVPLSTNTAPTGTNAFIYDDVFPAASKAFYRFKSAP